MSPGEPLSLGVYSAFLGMAAATYLMRAGGFYLMGHVPLTPRVRRMLEALPGSIVAATVLPLVANSGAAMLAVLAVGAAMIMRRNEFLAVAVGMAVAAGLRAIGLP
jgi:uncharacterized membrane protein